MGPPIMNPMSEQKPARAKTTRVAAAVALLLASLPLLVFSMVPNLRASAASSAVQVAPASGDVVAPFVGLPWSGESLGRMVVKDYSSLAVLFVAEETSQITSIGASLIGARVPWPANADEDSNYSAGNGGTIVTPTGVYP